MGGELRDAAKLYKELKEKYSEQIINEISGDILIKVLLILKRAAEN